MENAVKEANVTAKVNWHPFFLNPPGNLPEEGVPLQQYIESKYGTGAHKRASDHLNNAGSEVGINFNPNRKVVNTLRGHRLVEFAKRSGKEDEMVKKIFKAYFEDAKDINDINVLVEIAKEVALDADEVRKFLESDEDTAKVHNQVRESIMKHRIRGVPHFVIAKYGTKQKLAVSGAQPTEVFLSVFNAAQED